MSLVVLRLSFRVRDDIRLFGSVVRPAVSATSGAWLAAIPGSDLRSHLKVALSTVTSWVLLPLGSMPLWLCTDVPPAEGSHKSHRQNLLEEDRQ